MFIEKANKSVKIEIITLRKRENDMIISPKISIITITYNSSSYIERAITSIISQDYNNYEYIIIDGGSTDGTIDIIKKYENKIKKWISEPDKGISDAFNKGIKLSTGQIIGIINSDDGLMPNALNVIAESYDETVDVYRGMLIIKDDKQKINAVEIPSMQFDYSGFNHICHPSTFISKSAYIKYGLYDEKCKYVMDYDLLLRFQNMGAKFKYIDKPLAFFL